MKNFKKIFILILFILVTFVVSLCGCGLFSNNNSTNANDGQNSDVNGEEKEELPEFAGGNGSSNDPYIISAAYQWSNINKHLSSYFIIENDLNMGIGEISPIGSQQYPFEGNIDGNNHIIHDAKIHNDNMSGLFGVISGGVAKNIIFKDSTVSVDGTENTHCIGSLVGHIKLGGKIENCHSDNITCKFEFRLGLPRMGGIAGVVSSASEVIYCSSINLNIKGIPSGLVYLPEYVFGGVIGRVEGGKVDMCYSTGYFDDKSHSGTGASNRLIGGVIGTITGGSVKNVYSSITFKKFSDYTGSVVYNYYGGSIKFALSFCEFSQSVKNLCYYNDDKNDISTLKYLNATTIENSNNILNTDTDWKNNPYWKEGKIHPELVDYEEYLQLVLTENNT